MNHVGVVAAQEAIEVSLLPAHRPAGRVAHSDLHRLVQVDLEQLDRRILARRA